MAKINFGEELSSSKANSVYLLKSEDDTVVGILSLQNGVDPNKYVANLQEYLYEISDTLGITGEGDPNRTNYSSLEYIINGDSHKVILEKLDTQVKINATNTIANLALINDNAADIQEIIDSLGVNSVTAPLDVGIATLDADGRVPLIQLPNSLLLYQGTWDASTNTPTLANTDTGVTNFWYRVNVAGTVDFGAGSIAFNVGDKVVNNGTVWEKWDTNDEVTSVFGRTGDVVPEAGDYTPAQIGLGNVTNDAQLKRASGDFNTFTEKTEPVDDDIVLIEDSEDTFSKKKVKLANMLGGGGGGGGSFAWGLNEDISPIESRINAIEVLDFDYQSNMSISALIYVPESYSTGEQITLEGCYFTSTGSADNVFFRAQTTLFSTGSNIATSTNIHASINSEVTLSTANSLTSIGSLDLTDGTGQINGVAVSPGDILKVKLYRDNDNETISSVEDASFLRYSSSVKFKQ